MKLCLGYAHPPSFIHNFRLYLVFMFGSPTLDLHPIYNAPMLGARNRLQRYRAAAQPTRRPQVNRP